MDGLLFWLTLTSLSSLCVLSCWNDQCVSLCPTFLHGSVGLNLGSPSCKASMLLTELYRYLFQTFFGGARVRKQRLTCSAVLSTAVFSMYYTTELQQTQMGHHYLLLLWLLRIWAGDLPIQPQASEADLGIVAVCLRFIHSYFTVWVFGLYMCLRALCASCVHGGQKGTSDS